MRKKSDVSLTSVELGISVYFKGREVIAGYDTGPGNVLMDSWSMHNGIGPYDNNGDWARSGKLNDPLQMSLMDQDVFMEKSHPKSTGTDYYNIDFIIRAINECGKDIKPEDVQRTLLNSQLVHLLS